MSYHSNYLKARGQDCTILRPVPFATKASIKRSTRASRDLGIREGYWEGTILSEASLQSGELIEIRNKINQSMGKYLVQSTNYDPASEETAFFSAKCNAVIQHKRYGEDVDENGNLVQEWQDVNPTAPDVPCYGEIITYRLKQEDPGLLDGTKYTFQVPTALGVIMLDRFVYENKKYQVVSIDGIGMAGVSRVQCADDTRP